MKKLLTLALIFTFAKAHALRVQGAETPNHSIKISAAKDSDKLIFEECKIENTVETCKDFFPEKYAFDKADIVDMIQQKKYEGHGTVVLDAILIVVSYPFNAYRIGNAVGKYYYVKRLGYSAEGVGTVSGILAGAAIPTSTLPNLFLFDILDPYTHYDIADSLEAAIMENKNDALPAKDSSVTIDDLDTYQIVNSYKRLLRSKLKEQGITDMKKLYHITPAQRLLSKKMIGL